MIIAYLVGMLLGGWMGYSCGKESGVAYGDLLKRLRTKLQDWSDAVEVRLQDMDFETDKEWGRALGAFDAYYEVMNYMDNEMEGKSDE